MKFRLVLTFALSCSCLGGCKSKIAMDYNNMILKNQQELNKCIDETEPNLKNYFASYEYDSIASLSARMEAKIDSIVAAIKKTPAAKVQQGENFKKAALSYFGFMKSIYTSYRNYGLQTTPEGRQFQLQVMSTMTNQEDKAIADMQKAQKIFAKDNGFKIQSEKKRESKSLTANAPGQ